MSITIENESLDRLVAEVVSLSTRQAESGGIPFAALVVSCEGTILGTGVNQVTECLDPTAHAEVIAIRDACRHRRSTRLADALLIASSEPCALCYMAASYSGIHDVVFAADREDAARCGFDYRASYRLLSRDPLAWNQQRHHHHHANSRKPFDVWRENRGDWRTQVSTRCA